MKCLSVRANVTKEHSPYGYESLKKKKFRHLRLRYYYSEYNTTKCCHQKLLRCLKLCVETTGQRSNITQAAFIKQGQIKWSDI